MDWVRSGQPAAVIVLGADATRVERSAAKLVVSEVLGRSGVEMPVLDERELGQTPLGLILVGTPRTHRLIAASNVRAPADEAGEAIAVRVAPPTDGPNARPTAYAVGAGPKGALYAAVELLNHLVYSADGVTLRPLEVSHRPSFRFRADEHQGQPLYDPAGTDEFELYKRNIRYVARHRGNVICLGQNWPETNSALISYRHFPELCDPQRQSEFDFRQSRAREIVSLAADYGIDTYLLMVELRYPAELPAMHPEIIATDPPGGKRQYTKPDWKWVRQSQPRLCTSHPTTWAWYRAKVRELFEAVPDAAGMELWISWADTDAFYCDCERCRKLTVAERFERLIEEALAGMDEAAPGQNKRLVLRTYLGGWRHILAEEFFAPLAGRLSPRVVIGNKAQWGDMYYGNAPHPLAGQFAPQNDEIVEFCLGGEYRAGLRWGTIAPVSQQIEDRINLYARRGVTGVMQRHLDWRHTFNSPDFETFYALAWDLDTSGELVWQRWATERYGSDLGPQVVEILRDGTRVMAGALYVRGVALGSHTLFPESLERMRHLTFDRSAKLVDGGMERTVATPENIARIVAEKDEAIALSERVLERIERLRSQLPDQDYQALHLAFNLQHELALVYRELAELFWRYLRWSSTPSEVEREFQREDLLPMLPRFRAAAARLRERVPLFWRPELFEALGTAPCQFESGKTETSLWWRIDFAHGFPYSYLDTIAGDVERELNVEPGSLWAYFPRPSNY